MFRFAAAGRPLHHDFADKAATVDGEMVDVIGNMPLVRAFCGILREHRRFDQTVDREMASRPAQPALSREAAAHARADHDRSDHRPARLGDRAVAARRGDRRRRRAGMHAGNVGVARDARSGSRAGRRHPASRTPVGGACDPAAAARAARSSGSGAAACGGARASMFEKCHSPIRDEQQRLRELQPANSSPVSASAWSDRPAAASPPCLRCCSASTTCRTAAS